MCLRVEAREGGREGGKEEGKGKGVPVDDIELMDVLARGRE